MLILSRKVKESIIIAVGDGIEIRIVKVDGDTVKLAIDAPKDISIYRKEVLEAIKSSNLEAALDSDAPDATEALQNARKFKVSNPNKK